MIFIYIKLLKAIGKEIKRLYRESKKINDTDNYIIYSLMLYLVSLALIPLSLFTYLDGRGLYFLIFIPILICLVFDRYRILRRYNNRVIELSKKFKYYVSHKLLTIATIYWNGDY